jgi:hypothetical protein
MSTIINATTTNGVVIQPDNSGSLVLQTNSGTTALTIDTSQRAAFVAGTATLPAITTTGDTNTGMFFPAADTIAFAEGGAESMRLDSSGRVTMPFQPAFRAILGSSQTATFTGAYDVVFGNAVLNVGSCYSTSTGRFTAPVSGVYSLQTGIVAVNSYGPNFLVSELKINGSVSYTWFTSSVYASGGESGMSAATTVYLNANDYVQAIIYAPSSLTIGSAGGTWQQGRTYFSGFLVG